MKSDLIRYSSILTEAQIGQAAELIDSARKVTTEPSRRERLVTAPFKVAAINSQGEVVGIAAIKTVEREAGEAGFLTVRPDFRRLGIASELTRIRIEEARSMGLGLLYANARTTNLNSQRILRRAGYRYFGDFVSSFGTGNIISWYYLVVRTGFSPIPAMQFVVRNLDRPN